MILWARAQKDYCPKKVAQTEARLFTHYFAESLGDCRCACVRNVILVSISPGSQDLAHTSFVESSLVANVAQSAEQRFRKARVVSSILTVGSTSYRLGDKRLQMQGARVSVDSSVAGLPRHYLELPSGYSPTAR